MLLLCSAVWALDNGLGSRPGLGWNSDYCTNCSRSGNGFQNERFIRHIADAMVDMGFKDLGYTYVNMDASWDTPKRDRDGNLHNLGPGARKRPRRATTVHSLRRATLDTVATAIRATAHAGELRVSMLITFF